LRERQIADMVDRYHTLFAVPVFVLDPRHAKTVVPDVDEYLIGLDRRGNTHTAYGLTRGTVRSLAVDEGNNLFQHFCDLLGHPELRALQQLRASRPA
jgi:hypothetical protein